MASRCGQAAPVAPAAPERCSAARDEEGRGDGFRGTPSPQHSQVGDHRRQGFVGEIRLRPAGFEHPLQHRDCQLVHPFWGIGVDEHYGGGLHAVPRALVRGGVGQQAPGRIADQRECPPGGVALDGDRLSRRRRLDRAGQEVTRRVTRDSRRRRPLARPSKPRAKRVNSWGPAVAITDGRQMRMGPPEPSERGRTVGACASAWLRPNLGRSLAAASTRATPSSSRPSRCARRNMVDSGWCGPMRGGGAAAAAVAAGAVTGILCAAVRPRAADARLEVADQRGGGRMVEDERGRQIQPGERLELVAKLEGDEGIDAQLDEGDLRIEPRRRVVPERSRHRRADGIGVGTRRDRGRSRAPPADQPHGTSSLRIGWRAPDRARRRSAAGSRSIGASIGRSALRAASISSSPNSSDIGKKIERSDAGVAVDFEQVPWVRSVTPLPGPERKREPGQPFGAARRGERVEERVGRGIVGLSGVPDRVAAAEENRMNSDSSSSRVSSCRCTAASTFGREHAAADARRRGL